MNCHNNNGGEQNHSHKKHTLLMVLCCTLSIVIIAIFALFKINNPAMKGLLTGAAFLLCPLMHFLMLPMMFGWGKKNKKTNQGQYQPVQVETKNAE